MGNIIPAAAMPVNYSFRGMVRQGENALLRALGLRLREERERRGLSVTELAERAGLSRRHVTEAEAGRANLTVLKLAQLAAALGLPLGDLCDLPTAGPATERLALIGLRGAGKSTVGQALARRLEVPFVELDERIERLAGLSLSAIFDLQGQEGYRAFEREALEEVLAEGQRQVIATGGSIVASAETYARLRSTCRTVWLSALPEEHLQRVLDQGDHRPMQGHPRALEELREILERREGRYAMADRHLETSGRTPVDLAADLAGWVEGAGRA
jgi:XRE family aerobic/anaerobic benzoate catabolism transcriptional regulator